MHKKRASKDMISDSEKAPIAVDNKAVMQGVFTELSHGNLEPLFSVMAEDIKWIWMGSGPLAKSFVGKESVVKELFASVHTALAGSYKVFPDRFIGDGDIVAIEHKGQARTVDGRPYNNTYCWVCRFDGGKLIELREYMDTELVARTFGVDEKGAKP